LPPAGADDGGRGVVPGLGGPALPRRRQGDRGRRRRDAGNAGRGARQARANRVLPGALGGPERADGEVEGRGLARVSLRQEVTELLQELIRLDTVNPPGNETRAAEALERYLARNGVAPRRLAKTPDRANVVARLEGGDGPGLVLLAHTDTVLAEPSEWARDPWSGDLVDGEVWGRGALDMKGHVAAAAVAFASLAVEGGRPAGDVVLALTADEEVGVDFGASWLAREHPETLPGGYGLNEGGGERCVFGGRAYHHRAGDAKADATPQLPPAAQRGRAGRL